jgi:Cys-tRNA(Pro) deacylase
VQFFEGLTNLVRRKKTVVAGNWFKLTLFRGDLAVFVWSCKLSKKNEHISETPATQFLRQHNVVFSEHPYVYEEKGGTAVSARELDVDEHAVVKTLIMQDEKARPLIVLMHGDCTVSTKNLARQLACKSVEPCKPEVAQRHSGYLVGGTSPFATKKAMPVVVEEGILALEKIYINGGRRGFLIGIAPQILLDLLLAKPVQCALISSDK